MEVVEKANCHWSCGVVYGYASVIEKFQTAISWFLSAALTCFHPVQIVRASNSTDSDRSQPVAFQSTTLCNQDRKNSSEDNPQKPGVKYIQQKRLNQSGAQQVSWFNKAHTMGHCEFLAPFITPKSSNNKAHAVLNALASEVLSFPFLNNDFLISQRLTSVRQTYLCTGWKTSSGFLTDQTLKPIG